MKTSGPVLFLRCSLIAVSILFLSGCATVAMREAVRVERNKIYDTPFEKVWQAAVKGIEAKGEPVVFAEKDSGVIKVDRKFAKEVIWDYVSQSLWGQWEAWTNFVGEVNIVIRPVSSERTTVTVNTLFTGSYQEQEYNPGFFTDTYLKFITDQRLPSRGKLEREYFDLLEKNLQLA